MADEIQEEQELDQEPQNVMADEEPVEQEVYAGDVGINSILDETFSGLIISTKEDYAKTRFRVTKEMIYDSEGLAFNGFIYTAASWAAQVAINKEFQISVASKVNFLSPVRIGDFIDFEANAFFSESKKQDVRVVGSVNEVRVFEGTFSIILLEDHILRIQKRQLDKQARESRELRAKLKQ